MPCSDVSTPRIPKKEKTTMFLENIGIKGSRGRIVSFWPLPLLVGVIQDGSPFTSGEWQKVTPASLLESTMQEKVMVLKNVLILFITTPKEMNEGEGEPSSLGEGKEFKVIDMANGSFPDFLYF
jgi:hypothetical protein